ncbi:ABC transporter substrate-binding protein [Neobacillus drentensis]|uniref:ABC transporter substrate-binding protein n=1 Tax=Neobacillus drentensis TaxID=220684 RepID=UPI002FFDC38A
MIRSRLNAVISICLLLVFSSLAGCSNSSQTSGSGKGEKVTIDYWYTWGGAEAEEMKKLIDEFNKSQDRIFVKGLSQGDIQKQMTAIVGKNPPDLATHFDENRLASWAERGAMMPLDEYIKKDNYDFDDFLPSAQTAVKYNEKTYGLPIVMNTWMLYYNKDLLKEAGFDGPPETIQELEEYNKKLSKIEDGRIERLGIWPSQTPHIWMHGFGGQIWNPETKEVTAKDPGFKAIMEMNKRMWDQYGSDALDRLVTSEGKYDSAQNSFFTGKYAMSFDGEWLATFIKRFAPDFNYGIAPMPYDENHPESKNSGFTNVGVLYIPEGAKHPDEAWEFLSWITEKEQMAKFAAGVGNLPTRKSATEDPIFKDMPEYDTFKDYIVNGKMHSVPQVPFLEEYLTEIWTAQDEILRGKIDLEAGLNKIQEKIQPLADKTSSK